MSFVSNDKFRINGISSDSVGIFVDTLKIPPMAEQRYSDYQTGIDEDGTTPDNSFNNIQYLITFYTFDRPDFDNTDIYAFLADAQTLEINRLPNYYFKVRKVIPDDAPESRFNGQRIRYDVNFTLAPFKYRIENSPIDVKSNDIIINTGTRYSKPSIEITGAGETDFIFNGNVFKLFLPDEEQTVIVDSDKKIVYDKDSLSVLRNISGGKFPLLAVGSNQIQWNGPAKMKLWKNERCY